MSVDCSNKVNLVLQGVGQLAGGAIEITASDLMGRVNMALADPNVSVDAAVGVVTESITADFNAKQARHTLNAGVVAGAVSHVKDKYGGKLVKGVKSILIGDEGGEEGSRQSVALAQGEAGGRFTAGIYKDLDISGLSAVYWAGDLDEDVYKAGRAISRGDKEALAEIDPRAIEIADILEKHSVNRMNELNQHGAGIEYLPGRITEQFHNTHDIRHANKRVKGGSLSNVVSRGGTEADKMAWVDWTLSRLDHERTFDAPTRAKGEENKRRILSKIYDKVSIGEVGDNTLTEAFSSAKPGLDPSKHLRADRVLHFTDEGAYEYMRMFGGKTLRDSVHQEAIRAGDTVGLISQLGPDTFNNMKSILRELIKTAGPKDRQALSEFLSDLSAKSYKPGYVPKMSWMYTHVTGHNDRVVNDLPALIAAGVRTFEFITKLGFSAVSSTTDLAGIAVDLHYTRGDGRLFKNLSDGFSSAYRGLVGKERKRFAMAAGVGVDGMIHSMFSRFGAFDSPPGRMTQAMNMYFKWNALGPWTDAVRRGQFLANSNYFAHVFSDNSVSVKHRQLLAQYNVTKADIDYMVSNPPVTNIEGHAYFDSNLLPSELMKKMRSFFLDRNDHGVLTPGAETAYLSQGGRGRGDIVRELSSLFWQFKQFPYAMLTRNTFGRNITGRGAKGVKEIFSNPQGELSIFALHIALMTGMGAVSMNIKDVLKNRDPVLPKDLNMGVRYFQRAMLQGGSMGMVGDLLMGEVKGVGDFILRQGGPAFGDFLDFKDFSRESIRNVFAGDSLLDNQGGTELWRMMRNDLPFTNIWYAKFILDVTSVYHIAEMIDPGFLEKYNKELENTRGGAGLMYQPDIGGP